MWVHVARAPGFKKLIPPVALPATSLATQAPLTSATSAQGIPVNEFHAYFGALIRAGLGKRVTFGSALDLTEWAGSIESMLKPIEDARFLSACERTDIFFANAERLLTLWGHQRAARVVPVCGDSVVTDKR